jgi:prevent-host-death family protein
MLCLGWMRQFKSKMQTIEQCPIDEFQAHAEQYLRRVQRSQVPLFVTDPAGPALVIMPVGGLLALQQQRSMAEPIVRRVTPQQLEDDRLIEKGVCCTRKSGQGSAIDGEKSIESESFK